MLRHKLLLIASASLPRALLTLPSSRPFASSAPARRPRPRPGASSRPSPRRFVDEEVSRPKAAGRFLSRRPRDARPPFAGASGKDHRDEDLDPEQEYWERYLADCEPNFGFGTPDEEDYGSGRDVNDLDDSRSGGRAYREAEDEEDNKGEWLIQDDDSEDEEEDDSMELGYARMRAGKDSSQQIDSMRSDDSFSNRFMNSANARVLESEGDTSDESEPEWDNRQWQQEKDEPDADHEECLDSGSELSDMCSDDEQEVVAGTKPKVDKARAQIEEDQGRMGFDANEARFSLLGQRKSGTMPFDEKILGEHPRESFKEVMFKDYIISKSRLHGRFWRQELRRHGGGTEDGDQLLQEEDRQQSSSHSSLASGNKEISSHYGEDHSIWSSKLTHEISPEDWEGFMGSEEHVNKGISPREQQMVLEELQRRMEFNRRRISAFVKNHIFSRHRPVEGWNNIIETLRSRSKRVKAGRLDSSDDSSRPLNEMEAVIERHTAQARRRRF